jgi:hypothetical protein
LSSILKALKKVERESPNLDVVPELPKKIDTREVVNQRTKAAWVFKRRITAMVVILVLALGAWFLLANLEILERKLTGEGTPLQNSASAPVVASKKVDVQVLAPAKPKGAPHPLSTVTPARERATPVEKVRTKGIHALPKNPVEPARLTQTDPDRQDRNLMRPTKHRSDEARFKLEAIVWSASVQSRFAVINGQIVRAGGSVEGLSVIDISRDYVAVRSSGRDWKLRFTADGAGR